MNSKGILKQVWSRVYKYVILNRIYGLVKRKDYLHSYCKLIDIGIPLNRNEFVISEYYRKNSPIFKGIKLPATSRRKKRTKKEKLDRKKAYNEYIDSQKWKKFRAGLIKERGYACQKCGASDKQIHAHHLTYERIFNELPEDILLLCKPCHKKIHKK